MWRTVVVCAALLAVASSRNCASRPSLATGQDAGHYCVCNSTYCDDAPILIKSSSNNVYRLVTSTKNGLRFFQTRGVYGNVISIEKPIGSISLDATKKYQKIIGFGGAVTDSAGINILSLSPETNERLLQNYFGEGGLNYNMIRTPMGGTDFSTRPYSYTKTVNDTLLKDFTLQPEDYKYKMPILRRALRMSKYYIKLITAPWSPPPWMKTNNDWTNKGTLRPEYKQTWADYFVKYFKAYKQGGFEFWGLTPQNEPEIGTYLDVDINGMTWTRDDLRDWVVQYLAPTLREHGLSAVKIFAGDDNRQSMPGLPNTTMSNPEVRKIYAGTTVHWYFDKQYPPSRLDETKKLFPEKLILMTEACAGVLAEKRVILGSWQRGEDYARNIIENMNHWVSSWVDWNMALNLEGGPTYVRNFVDSPIIVNSTADEFYKQPMFYAMGHFSKYVPPGSLRISSKSSDLKGVDHIAFLTPEEAIVAVFVNTNNEEIELLVNDLKKGRTRMVLPPKSINTMKYW